MGPTMVALGSMQTATNETALINCQDSFHDVWGDVEAERLGSCNKME